MRIRSIASAVLVAGLSVLWAPAVHAGRESAKGPAVHVVAIRSYDADYQAEALTVALRNRIRELRGWTLGAGDHSLEVLTLGLKCGEVPDASCQAKIGQQIGSDRYIWGTLRKVTGGQVVADLHLWARGKPATETQLTYSDNLTAPGDDALKRLVDDAVAKLVAVGETGTVVVRSQDAASGDLYVDGKPHGAMQSGEMKLALAPGTHQIELRRGAEVQKGTVSVRPGASVELHLAFASADATSAGTSSSIGASLSDAPTVVQPRPGLSSSKVMGWSALGMGLALTGGGIYSMVRVRQTDNDEGFDRYRRGFGADQDVCDEARAGNPSAVPGAATPDQARQLCSTASTFQTLQYVFLGLGAVSTGAGIYLLVRNPNPPATAANQSPAAQGRLRWDVTPRVGRSAANVDLRVEF
jgi:hypothetical protein